MTADRPPKRPPVDGIVLAAGLSRRMGRPKALLEIDGEPFVERAVRVLREGGCRAVVAVVREGDDWIGRLADAAGAMLVINHQADSEQHDSLRFGLEALPDDAAAAVVLPVDLPVVRAATVRAVIDAFEASGAALVRPVHGGRPGHPGLFARSLFDELRRSDLPHGAHSVIEAHAAELEEVEVADEGVLVDVNTPAEYERLAGDA